MRLRVALLGVKPTAWRRIEIAVSATLGDLHTVIQTAMGWQDLHLHSFRILGRQYDPGHGAIGEVRLADLRLRAGERFSYVYNHSAPWAHELRVEAVGSSALGRQYPRCVAGQHACPPEWCPGPEAYDEIKAELFGLSYTDDLQLMAGFGRAVVLAARGGTLCDALNAVNIDELKNALARHERREALSAPFDRRRANTALGLLAAADSGATT
jgi:hypothetical protein